ncbi:MAG: AraC family transcriptional regulator [Proteobacteria bacterium]|nr:AraC family transcriptional regulator [Pseudomonadota bacterium]
MDALSDVLRAVRLNGAVFFDIRAADPWVARTPAGMDIVGAMFPGAEHLISYHVLISGGCWAGPPDSAPIRLQPGDVIVFPHGDTHVLSSAPGMHTPADLSRYRKPAEGQRLPFSISMGEQGGTETAHFVCGFLGCDVRPFNPLLAALPRVVRVRDSTGTLAAYVQAALSESRLPRIGSECVLSRLSELMFVELIRQYLEGLPPDRADWLAGLRDAHVGRALNALHRTPERAWDLPSLARHVGLSRTVLAERFSQFVGRPPMQYLANWRMQLATGHLLAGSESVAQIANRVGYDSEAAFSRTFKKLVGSSPGQWRRERSAAR